MPDIDWLHLPPLPALRAFEATSRLGGFSAAARSLNVTHAAVAQQVRALEAALGVPLVTRSGRNLALSSEGAALAAALTESFGAIQSAVDDLRIGAESLPVTITLTPAFANNWLMPRLGRLWADHPDIAVSLRPDPNVLDLRRERIDFGIRFGMGEWPGVEARYLTSARYVVVGAPALFEGRENLSPAEMAGLPWILEEHWPEQRSWIICCTGLDPDMLSITEFGNEELALAAARQGYGLHLSATALVEHDLAAGNLRLAFEADEEGPGYFIVTPKGSVRAAARTVIRWLLKAV
ncbi:Glycine cleavage system transcriptional activator [Defluviimonas aquaemixtae]|uniref:Glycine cleavage system transcriptional activator n=1 Tax=Albidovulum aquaemixtae TaxID=1542388 RepID=A0A2R8BJC5_9RHOB|nr:LysR family transcriptional regulator [Defluviimonas aquaemixtae]SPH23510.1 Glycine cleavage system transcriptional activator [Defluviimonas aquaemixtae]